MVGFEYPAEQHTRRHGPAGYKNYGSYREWLRDEFMFRCVYCLRREQWDHGAAAFHIDHLVPVSEDPDRECEYSNLLYTCATCNGAKKAILGVPDPCEVSFHDCLRIMSDGRVEALNEDGEKLRQALRLNKESRVRNRSRWMRNLEVLRTTDPDLYQEYMGFPDDLPDLRTKQVPVNTNPEGATNCSFALRERGELPAVY